MAKKIGFQRLTKAERAAVSSKGGKATAKARRAAAKKVTKKGK